MTTSLDVPEVETCAFCEYLSGARAYTILRRDALTATFVTREQRGVGHVLVLPIVHRETILDLTSEEACALILSVRTAAGAISQSELVAGISIWQNNGVPADQTIPHVHFHVAGTLPAGGTERGDVPELTVSQTDIIGRRLRAHLDVR